MHDFIIGAVNEAVKGPQYNLGPGCTYIELIHGIGHVHRKDKYKKQHGDFKKIFEVIGSVFTFLKHLSVGFVLGKPLNMHSVFLHSLKSLKEKHVQNDETEQGLGTKGIENISIH